MKEDKIIDEKVEKERPSKLVIDHIVTLKDTHVCPDGFKSILLTKKDIESFSKEAVEQLGLEPDTAVFYPKDK